MQHLFKIGHLFLFSLTMFMVSCSPADNNNQEKQPSFPGLTQRVALVIGNSEYYTGSLKNPVNDAQSVAKVLNDLGFAVDYYSNLDQKGMVDHIFDFYHHKAKNAALRIIYYAGHGFESEGRNYLIPVDANLAIPHEIPPTSFKLDELRNALDDLKRGASIIILDTCRVNLCPDGHCRDGMSNELAKERPSTGTLIAYSTRSDSQASDGENMEHSLYTQILTELLPKPGLSIEKLFKILNEQVRDQSGGKQKPEFVNGLTAGAEICLKTGSLGQCPVIQ